MATQLQQTALRIALAPRVKDSATLPLPRHGIDVREVLSVLRPGWPPTFTPPERIARDADDRMIGLNLEDLAVDECITNPGLRVVD